MVEEDLAFRPHKDEDISFIYATWLNSYYYGSRFAQTIRKTVFYKHHSELIARLLALPTTRIIVCCAQEHEDTIFGYMVYQLASPPIIQFTYVKGPFQRFGIARDMVKTAGVAFPNCVFTHWTFDTDWIMDKYPELTYNPYLIA